MNKMGLIYQKFRAHGAGLGATANKATVAALPQNEPHGVKDNRFASAGFTRKHAQARLKLQLQPVDQHNVLNGKRRQHALRALPEET